MPRYQTGRNHRRDKTPITPDDVFAAIIVLAEALATLPTQAMVADHLKCSQQHISFMMQILSNEGRIVWLSQRVYYVDRSHWQGPDDSSAPEFSSTS
jgi:hypothetical protein